MKVTSLGKVSLQIGSIQGDQDEEISGAIPMGLESNDKCPDKRHTEKTHGREGNVKMDQ